MHGRIPGKRLYRFRLPSAGSNLYIHQPLAYSSSHRVATEPAETVGNRDAPMTVRALRRVIRSSPCRCLLGRAIIAGCDTLNSLHRLIDEILCLICGRLLAFFRHLDHFQQGFRFSISEPWAFARSEKTRATSADSPAAIAKI
jgi:hypothetical protein